MGIFDRRRLQHSVGIETKGGKFTPLIPKGAPLPASVTETFTTADPNQPSIQLASRPEMSSPAGTCPCCDASGTGRPGACRETRRARRPRANSPVPRRDLSA